MKATSIIDLYKVANILSIDFKGSLASLCVVVLDIGLDKRMQVSDWQQRPLTSEQVSYAAMDAFVLILLLNRITNQFSLQVKQFEENYDIKI